MSKEFYQKLMNVQRNLNAPKGQRNNFGKYNYRSCEDILEAVKPLLFDNGLFLSISDDIKQVGDRFYVESTATITDGECSHTCSAMAREALEKKGMDSSQVTGATSSYARKYCLNGLFGIDDSKDADTDEYRNQQSKQTAPQKLSQEDQAKLKAHIEKNGYTVEQICQSYNVKSLADFNADMAKPVCQQVSQWAKAAKK